MTASGEPLLELRDVAVGWDEAPVLTGVTFSLSPGGTMGIVGPNGAGKSTLLQALLGLRAPLAGRLTRSAAWRAGYVPQRESSEPLLRFRADEVVAMAAEPAAWRPFSRTAERRRAAAEALREVGMEDHAARPWIDLSGGQRQRVLVARALAAAPTVLVLDEPTTGMDVRAEEEFLALLRRLRAGRGVAILIVTHDLHIVADEAETVGLAGGGHFVAGPVDEVVTAERLSSLWGTPVDVVRVGGRRVIRAARAAEASRSAEGSQSAEVAP